MTIESPSDANANESESAVAAFVGACFTAFGSTLSGRATTGSENSGEDTEDGEGSQLHIANIMFLCSSHLNIAIAIWFVELD